MAAKGILGMIGNTPLVNVNGILAKLEAYNPTGSVKDRMAHYIVKKAAEETNKAYEVWLKNK